MTRALLLRPFGLVVAPVAARGPATVAAGVSALRAVLLAVLFAAALGFGGCASVAPGKPGSAPPAPSPPAAPAAPPSADSRAAAPAALATERAWLQSWFKDTPVQIAQRADGAVTIEVPREFSFDPGRSKVKPALAAVLNKVAESLRRVPQARLPLVAAPGDGAAGTPLALQRAEQVHKHLLSNGVPAARLGLPQAASGDAVQLRMEPPPS